MCTWPLRSAASAAAWLLSVLTMLKSVRMAFFNSVNWSGEMEFCGTTSAIRKCGRPPVKPSPNKSRTNTGPRIRLRIRRGCRKTSLASFVKSASTWVMDLNIGFPFPLHQLQEDFIKRRCVLLGLEHVDPVIAQHGDQVGQGCRSILCAAQE